MGRASVQPWTHSVDAGVTNRALAAQAATAVVPALLSCAVRCADIGAQKIDAIGSLDGAFAAFPATPVITTFFELALDFARRLAGHLKREFTFQTFLPINDDVVLLATGNLELGDIIAPGRARVRITRGLSNHHVEVDCGGQQFNDNKIVDLRLEHIGDVRAQSLVSFTGVVVHIVGQAGGFAFYYFVAGHFRDNRALGQFLAGAF